jgi:Protein of unknown function (DUF3054)
MAMTMMILVSLAPYSRLLFVVCLLLTILSRASSFSSTPAQKNVMLSSSNNDKTKTLTLSLRYSSSFVVAPWYQQQQQQQQPLFASSSKIERNNDSGESSDDYVDASSPLDRPWQAAVDAAALVTFAAVGRANHADTNANLDGGFDNVLAVAATAAPFLLAWFATSPFTNVYCKTEKGKSLQESLVQIVPGWAIAVPLGCILRGIIKGYIPPLGFVVVTLIATLMLLGLGRVLYNLVEEVFVELV